MYLRDRLMADSPVAAPSGLTLARISDEERSIMLARAMHDAARWSPALYPNYVLTAEEAAKLAGFIAFILLALGFTPGRVRVGLAVARTSPLRRLRRGHVILVIVVFGMTLTPLTCVQPAHAGGSGGSPPPGSVFPVYFVHSDHLGSTLLLTCYEQGSTCPDATVARYYRYDAYGQTTAYNASGGAVTLGTALIPQSGVSYVPERLYTGQRWDWQAQVYYYGARMYDPRVANFLTEDPARQYANPYAYVGWNPLRFTDPTGAIFDSAGSFTFVANYALNGLEPPGTDVSIDDLTMSANFAALKALRGLAPGDRGRNAPGGPGGAASSLLQGGLAGYLRFGGLSADEASVGAQFLAEYGIEGVLGTNLAGVLAGAPGGIGYFKQLTAAVGEGGRVATAAGVVGWADLVHAGAALSDLAQLAAILPAPGFLAGPAISLDVLAFGLTQLSLNAALANGLSQTSFEVLSDLNLVSLVAGIAGNVGGSNATVFLGATAIQLGAFLTIDAITGFGPVSGPLVRGDR
jgi:RHS repeat-associated protein